MYNAQNVVPAKQQLLTIGFPKLGVAATHTHTMDMDARCTREVELIGLESDKLGMEEKGR